MRKYDVSVEQQKLNEINKWSAKHTNTIGREPQRLVHVSLIKQLFPNSKSILCVGSRIDHEVATFRNNGFDAIGIDIAYESDLVKRIDAHELMNHFEEGQFDIVYSSHSLEHMYDAELVLENIKKVSKNGVFITLPCKSKLYKSHCSVFDLMVETEDESLFFDVGELSKREDLLEDFKNLKPYELIFYKKRETSPKKYEFDVVFRW
jgi:SAM-dependent methyltransferase